MYVVYLGTVPLPIAPSKIQAKIKGNNKEFTLINEGEINVLKQAGLTEFNFDVSFPMVKYPFGFYPQGFKPADFYLSMLESLMNAKRPFQFIVARDFPNGKDMYDTNMKVSIEDYTITEDAKDGFDVTVKISLKQYREFSTKKITVPVSGTQTTTATAQRETSSAPAKKTYTVVKGDWLEKIAKKQLGDWTRWKEIYNLNKDKIKNPDLIYPGQVFILP